MSGRKTVNSLESTDSQINNDFIKSIVHPSVLKIQLQIHQPSPCYIVKDQDQPSEGYVKKSKSKCANNPAASQSCSSQSIGKEVTLKLGLNPLFINRRNRVRCNI